MFRLIVGGSLRRASNGDRSERNGVIGRLELNRERLRARVEENTEEMHFMITGVIQGGALGVILLAMTTQLALREMTPNLQADKLAMEIVKLTLATIRDPGTLHLILRYFLSLFVIVLVTFEYTFYQGIFPRYPRYRDVIQPIFLGMAEIAPLLYFQSAPKWWLFNGLFVILCLLSYLNTITRIRDHQISSRSLKRKLYIGLLVRIFLVVIAMMICFLAAYCTYTHPKGWLGDLIDIMDPVWELALYASYGFVGFIILIRGKRLAEFIERRL